ncbi:hypothetical protein NGM37_29010, partial [Streptomyces sp. TRM76130]|nr:hypothetical protein [Streptomyces sp. TRM76130]
MADEPRIGRDLHKAPWLTAALLRNHGLVDQARADGPLWRAARAGEALADALTPQVVRRLAGRGRLLEVLTADAESLADIDPLELRRLLGDAPLTRFLDTRTESALRFFTVPGWRAAALGTPGFAGDLERLARDPERFRELTEDPSGELLPAALAPARAVSTADGQAARAT